jgi:poly(3-hydroxybutyrate) depolymerase
MMTIQGGRDSLRETTFVTANQQWRAGGGCGPETVTPMTLRGPAERRASSCAKSGEHVIYHATEMGHEWPTEASTLIWGFFAEHPKP